MKNKDEVLLQIFAENEGTGENETLPQTGSTTESGSIDAADAGRAENIITNGTANAGDTDNNGEDDTDAEFEELIKGKYAGEFARRTQKIIDKRFRQTKLAEAENQRLQGIITEISDALGCGEDDILSVLGKKIDTKQSKEESGKTGLPDSSEMERVAAGMFEGFDLAECMKDARFREYLEKGLTYSEAYALTNLDLIKKSAAGEGAKEAVRSIGSMGTRMPEFTAASQGMPSFRPVSSLTSAEIRDIVGRASAGERIDLAGMGLI